MSSEGDLRTKGSKPETNSSTCVLASAPEATTEDPLDQFVRQTHANRTDPRLLERFERVTGHKPHRYLRRGIVFSHRELDAILDKYERGLPFYLFTGRGPSSDSLHIGHTVPFEFTK